MHQGTMEELNLIELSKCLEARCQHHQLPNPPINPSPWAHPHPRPPPIWPVAPSPWAVHWAPPGPLPARARRAPRRSLPWRWVPVPTRPPTSAWDGKIGKREKIGKLLGPLDFLL